MPEGNDPVIVEVMNLLEAKLAPASVVPYFVGQLVDIHLLEEQRMASMAMMVGGTIRNAFTGRNYGRNYLTVWVKRLPDIVGALNIKVTSLIREKNSCCDQREDRHLQTLCKVFQTCCLEGKKAPPLINVIYLY